MRWANRSCERVPYFSGLTILDQTAGEAVDQPVARLRGLEQDRAAVRARVRLIERRDEGLVEEVGKRTVCAIVSSFNGNASAW